MHRSTKHFRGHKTPNWDHLPENKKQDQEAEASYQIKGNVENAREPVWEFSGKSTSRTFLKKSRRHAAMKADDVKTDIHLVANFPDWEIIMHFVN